MFWFPGLSSNTKRKRKRNEAKILEKKKWSLLWKFWSMNKGPDCFHSPTDKVRSTINLIGLMRNNESVFACLNFTFRLFAIDTIRTDSLIDVIVVDPFCNCRILQHKPNLTITDQQFNEPLTGFHSLLLREANEKIDAGEKRRERMLTIDGHSDLQTSLTSTSYFTRFSSHCTKVHAWCWSSTHHARQRLRQIFTFPFIHFYRLIPSSIRCPFGGVERGRNASLEVNHWTRLPFVTCIYPIELFRLGVRIRLLFAFCCVIFHTSSPTSANRSLITA